MAKQANFDLGYSVIDDGDKRHIKFRGDGLPWIAYVIIPIVFLALSPLLLTAAWIVPVVIIGGTSVLAYLSFQPQSFTLSATAIIKSGRDYDLAKISEVLIDNPMDKEVSVAGQPAVIIGGTGIAGASIAATSMMANAASSAVLAGNMAISRSAAKRRFRVRIRYGAKVVTLARNLKHDRAVAIFQLLTKP
ncbi:hypothetical protein [Roseovarius mucosus]|uniref:hypothetical protein n=1 Tax=Roseovarius mucosus TaxID=215743 RepID=UPI003F7241A5